MCKLKTLILVYCFIDFRFILSHITLLLSRSPEQQCSFEKRTPIIIYKFILFTPIKEQLTFTTFIFNYTNTEQSKPVGWKNGLGFTIMLNSYHYISFFMSFVNISMSFYNFFHWIASVNHSSQLSCFAKVFEKD